MVLMAFPGVADAQGYGTGNFLAVSDNTVVRGQSIVVIGCCFDGTVDVAIESVPQVLGQATAGDDGTFSLTVTIPSDARLGVHAITATGDAFDGSGRLKLSTPITVLAAAGAGGGTGTKGDLPRTGENTFPLVQLGGVLVLAGAGMVLAVRSRRDATARRQARATVGA
jgi:alpha-L-fucosidase